MKFLLQFCVAATNSSVFTDEKKNVLNFFALSFRAGTIPIPCLYDNDRTHNAQARCFNDNIYLSRPTSRSPWLFVAMVRPRMSIRAQKMPPTSTPVSKDAQRQRPSTVDPCDSSSVRPPPPEEGGTLAVTADGRRSLTASSLWRSLSQVLGRDQLTSCAADHTVTLSTASLLFRP